MRNISFFAKENTAYSTTVNVGSATNARLLKIEPDESTTLIGSVPVANGVASVTISANLITAANSPLLLKLETSVGAGEYSEYALLSGYVTSTAPSAVVSQSPVVSLKTLGLTDSTTDISSLIALALSQGIKHIVVPYRAAAWPATSTITLTDAWLEFEPGARISLNHATAGMIASNSIITNASFTSAFTGPASVADATSPNYGFPAREITLNSNNVINGSYYQEYATNGIHFVGSHNRITGPVTFKNMRHQQGWASCIHSSGTSSFDNVVSGQIYIENCDRGLENEDGAHHIYYTGGGYLKNVYPNGYTGQASAATYAGYTFVLDAHCHQDAGGVDTIVFDGAWTLENCGGGFTAVRSSGTNAADMPKNCRVTDLRIIGKGMATGYEDIAIQGTNNYIGRLVLEVGAGIAGTSFKIRSYTGSSNNTIRQVNALTAAAQPIVTDDAISSIKISDMNIPMSSALRANKYISLPNSPVSTGNALGNGIFRATAIYIPTRITVDQLGAEVTAAGDAGSVLRIGIFSDNGGLPANVLADVTVASDAIGTPMTTLATPVALNPGWYHIGGVLQGVTTTQPTFRVCTTPEDGYLIFNPSTTAVSPMGYSKGGLTTGALPAWGTSIATTNIAPRIWARVSSAL